ncbi:cytochrome P450 734A1-like [Impatiens glandulifera]|uniref:cytochrome P450 734A1-like n=1 Tax=Impatiens glandulifera TaxID=253017 RepID=UPI001FB0D865|nr:cytochrome P450 734A1-like [Impatiens glandulifera]
MEVVVWWWLMAAMGGYMVAFVWVKVWWRPRKIQRQLSKQGINGPPYHLLLGNIKEIVSLTAKATSSLPLSPPHNILPRVLPFYHHWNKIYGSTFVLWFGSSPRLIISESVLIREILVVKQDLFEKVDPPTQMKNLEGHGLTTLNGHKWSLHRRILSPLFHIQNIKLMVPTICKTTKQMLDTWSEMSSSSTSGNLEIELSQWFLTLTGDIITHAVFGTSYQQGKAIFNSQAQQVLDAIGSYNKVSIPGFRFVPTKKNRDSWKLERQMRTSLIKLIEERIKNIDDHQRRDNCFAGDDVLDLMIKARISDQAYPSSSTSESAIAVEDIVGECKNMFFAGKQTTSNLLTWTTILLAMHPTWQEKARDEVLSVCGAASDIPTKDDVTKLKTLGMIVNESLRLYPPPVAILRRAKVDVELGGYVIPGGTQVLIPTLAVHHDPILWGNDSTEFNPDRFSKGVAGSTNHPMAFMPFGIGPRRCIGQNLAILQAKLTLAMILKRFTFHLSPEYRHAPTIMILLQPQHGAKIIVRKL